MFISCLDSLIMQGNGKKKKKSFKSVFLFSLNFWHVSRKACFDL